MAEKKSSSKKVKCPRCGALGWIQVKRISGRYYYYCVHYEGKGKRRYCYLGPDIYEYASRTHAREGLVLRGLSDRERVIAYLDAIIMYLERNPLEPELAERLAEKLEQLAKGLREYARKERGKEAEEGAN